MAGEHDAAAHDPALRLAHLFATRLCHDLSGPLSGLGAALGELPDDPEALPLAHDAARALRQRIALLRAAWGEPPPPLARAALLELACGLPNAARLRIDLNGLPEQATFAPAAARLLLNVLLLAAESLPGGGDVRVEGSPSGRVLVGIAGRRAAWPVGLGALFGSAEAARRAVAALRGTAGLRAMQAPLTALLAHDAGIRVAPSPAGDGGQASPLQLHFAPHC